MIFQIRGPKHYIKIGSVTLITITKHKKMPGQNLDKPNIRQDKTQTRHKRGQTWTGQNLDMKCRKQGQNLDIDKT